jgi:Tfp pilus assembly protein PilV
MKPKYQNPNQPAASSCKTAPSFRISGFGFRVSRAPTRAAFSFAEVMFAVVILGIGFIMIAAIFPVAMQQSQATNDESIAAAIAREATNTITALPQTYPDPMYDPGIPATNTPSKWPDEPQFLNFFPATVKNHTLGTTAGSVRPPAVVALLSGARWDAIRNNLILLSDQRYAYVPFYRRENNSKVVQLIVIGIAIRNRSIYQSNADTSVVSAGITAPALTAGTFTAAAATTIYPDTVTVTTNSPRPGYYVNVTRTGINSLSQTIADVRTYRLGRPINATAGTFELEPPDDLRRTTGNLVTSPTSDGLWGTSDDVRDTNYAATLTLSTASPYNPQLIPNSTLQPIAAFAQLTFPSDSLAGRITLYDMIPSSGALVPPQAAAEGAFVIIADDYPYGATYSPTTGIDSAVAGSYVQPPTVVSDPLSPPQLTVPTGQSNGRIYRLGTAVPNMPGTYDLDPNFGMQRPGVNGISPDQLPLLQSAAANGPLAKVYIVGRGRTDPTAAAYSGAAQDIAVYTTFIPAQ